MRWTLAAALAAALAGAGATAPAARAGDDCGRVEIRRPVIRIAVGGHSRHCGWRPAHFEDRVERVVVRGGFWREEPVPASVGIRFDFGRRRFVRAVLRPATVVRAWVPPVVGERVVRVLVPGRWDCACD